MANYTISLNVAGFPGFGGAGIGGAGAGVGVGGGGGMGGGGPTPNQQKQVVQQAIGGWQIMRKVFLPFVAGVGLVGLIMQIINHSRAVAAFSKAMADILDAIVTVFFAPLFPLWVQILRVIQLLIPIVSSLAKLIFEPLVKAIIPAVKGIGDLLALWIKIKDEGLSILWKDPEAQKAVVKGGVDIIGGGVGGLAVPATARAVSSLFGLGVGRAFGGLAGRLLGGLLGSAMGPAGAIGGAIAGGVLADFIMKKLGFQEGTPFVPRNMLAFLHKGEAVIPAKYNTSNIKNSSANVQNNFNITTNNIDPTFLGNELQRSFLQSLNFRLRQ